MGNWMIRLKKLGSREFIETKKDILRSGYPPQVYWMRNEFYFKKI